MRYAFHDVGERQEGDSVLVRLHGIGANVILVDELNFARYRAGEGFLYEGGFCSHPSVELEIPGDGHWYVVVDTGGSKGRVRSSVEIHERAPEGAHASR